MIIKTSVKLAPFFGYTLELWEDDESILRMAENYPTTQPPSEDTLKTQKASLVQKYKDFVSAQAKKQADTQAAIKAFQAVMLDFNPPDETVVV